ncbi:MAG: sigma-54 dependent transcriptional regulator [Planctomycetota bacterium]
MTPLESKESILLVDDAPDTIEILQRNLSSKGYRIYTSSNVEEAMRVLDGTPVDLVITDLKMPRISGLDLVRFVRENLGNTEVMLITGYASIEGAVEAVKAGAEEYLAKPFTDEELFNAVDRVLDKLKLRRVGMLQSLQSAPAPCGLLGKSATMQKVFSCIVKAAATSATVLVTGESGTGKELVARAIHYASARASAPFVPVNCGGIPEGLLESELFGYVKGAFTGALESRAGFFQTADGGTIFLDEISNTSPAMQAKLLRVLQNKEISMVGDAKTRKVDVRIIAATNKDLASLVKKEAFRDDLFFRLNVINIHLPALRERGEDVLLLAHHFVKKYAGEFGKPVPYFTDKALDVLRNYSWPGNVRELENLIQRIIVMSDNNIIDISDMPPFMRFSLPRENNFSRTLDEVENEYIKNVLTSVDGNKTRAAEILGINRKTLQMKLKKFVEATSEKTNKAGNFFPVRQ